MNLKRIATWQEYLGEFRNCIGTASMNMFLRWFDLSKFITNTANKMLYDGTLYKYLGHDDIGQLQVVMSELNWEGERYLNQRIDLERTLFDKERALKTLAFWEQNLKNHKTALEGILSRLA